MRRLHVRLTIRSMMIAVAVAAVVLLGVRHYRHYRLTMWFREANLNPVVESHFRAEADSNDVTVFTGQTVPILLDYEFKFSLPKPPRGLTFRIRAEAWLEDEGTKGKGTVVDRYVIYRDLASGEIENFSGKTTWNAKSPSSGRYGVFYRLSYRDPLGQWKENSSGGSRSIRVRPPEVPKVSSPNL